MSMTIPTIPSLPAGYIATAADMNNLGAACTFLMTKPLARIRDTAGGQAISSAGPTTINFSSADIDTDGMWNVSTPSRLTIQTPGWYKLRYAIAIVAGSTIRVNPNVWSTTGSNNPLGSGVTTGPYWGGYAYSSPNDTEYAGASGVWPFYLYQGDYLFIKAISDNADTTAITAPGSTANGGSYFSLEYVSI